MFWFIFFMSAMVAIGSWWITVLIDGDAKERVKYIMFFKGILCLITCIGNFVFWYMKPRLVIWLVIALLFWGISTFIEQKNEKNKNANIICCSSLVGALIIFILTTLLNYIRI